MTDQATAGPLWAENSPCPPVIAFTITADGERLVIRLNTADGPPVSGRPISIRGADLNPNEARNHGGHVHDADHRLDQAQRARQRGRRRDVAVTHRSQSDEAVIEDVPGAAGAQRRADQLTLGEAVRIE